MDLPAWLAEKRADAIEWCHGRVWWVRLPLLLWFAYILVNHLLDGRYQSLFKPLNLGIHELGHPLFGAFGQLMGILGGSLLQLIAPAAGIALFFRQRDYFAVAVGLAWLGTSLFDVATYVADARTLALDLVSPGGGEPIHDWAWLLEHMGMLTADHTIAFLMRGAATIFMLASLALGGWLIRHMAASPAGEAR